MFYLISFLVRVTRPSEYFVILTHQLLHNLIADRLKIGIHRI